MSNVIMNIGLVLSFNQNHLVFATGRFFYGFGVGLLTFFCPKYVSEFAPVCVRGMFGSLTEVWVSSGIMIPFLLGPLFTASTVDDPNPSSILTA